MRTLQTVYGAHVNGEEYLRKFFDYQFHLRAASHEAFSRYLVQRELGLSGPGSISYQGMNDLANGRSLSSDDLEALTQFEYEQYFTSFSQLLGLSVRDQVQAFTIISGFVRARRETVTLPFVDCFVACARFGCNSLFASLVDDGTVHIRQNEEAREKKFALGWRQTLLEMFFEGEWSPMNLTEFVSIFHRDSYRKLQGSSDWRKDPEFLAYRSMAYRLDLLPDFKQPHPYIRQLIRLSELVQPDGS